MYSNRELIKSKRKELKQLNKELQILESKLDEYVSLNIVFILGYDYTVYVNK